MSILRKTKSLDEENFSDDDEKRIMLETSVEMIKDDFGIDLNWGEIAGLKRYTDCFWKSWDENKLTASPSWDALHYFMVDYFGLDMIELGRTNIRVGRNKQTGWKAYGSGFIGEKSFKKYCRMYVNHWREERTNL